MVPHSQEHSILQVLFGSALPAIGEHEEKSLTRLTGVMHAVLKLFKHRCSARVLSII